MVELVLVARALGYLDDDVDDVLITLVAHAAIMPRTPPSWKWRTETGAYF